MTIPSLLNFRCWVLCLYRHFLVQIIYWERFNFTDGLNGKVLTQVPFATRMCMRF